MIVQLAPITIISPERMKIEKSIFRSPKSHRLIGSTNQIDQPKAGRGAGGTFGQAQPLGHRHQAEEEQRHAEPERDRVLARSRPRR